MLRRYVIDKLHLICVRNVAAVDEVSRLTGSVV